MPRPADPRGQKRKPEDDGVDAFDTSPLKSDKWVPTAEAMRVTKVVAGSRTSAVIAESIRGGSPIGSSSFRLVGTDEVAGPPVEQDEHRGEEEGIPKPDRNLAHREAIGCTKRGVPENSSHKSSGFPSSNISRAEKYVFLNAALSAKIAASCVEREEFKKTHFVGVHSVEAVKPISSAGAIDTLKTHPGPIVKSEDIEKEDLSWRDIGSGTFARTF